MAAPDPSQIAALVANAAEILDDASEPFIAGHRADSAVAKKGNDFATEVDLAIERQVVEALSRRPGSACTARNSAGSPSTRELVWVLDPIDGTFNYAAGSPMAAILLGLLRDGEPVARADLAAVHAISATPRWSGGRCACNGDALAAAHGSDDTVGLASSGIGTFNIDSRGAFPGRYRLAVLENLSRKCSRMRMHGATGIDLAYVAAGILGGGNQFRSSHLGPRRGCGAGAGGRRRRHRPGR